MYVNSTCYIRFTKICIIPFELELVNRPTSRCLKTDRVQTPDPNAPPFHGGSGALASGWNLPAPSNRSPPATFKSANGGDKNAHEL